MDIYSHKNINMDKVVAIIPARGESKSVPKKNIRNFNGFPLIAYTIAAARMSQNIERVVVSTDSEEIAEIARYYGAEVPFLRPAEISGDTSTDLEFMEHAINWFIENEGETAEYLVHLRPTTPIRDSEIIDKAITKMKDEENATAMRSGHLCVHPPFKWFTESEDDFWKPLMAASNDEANMPRQDFPKVYIPNGYVDVVRASHILEFHLLYGSRMLGFVTEEIPDIDTELDLKKLEIYDTHRKAYAQLHEFLKGHFENKEKLQ